MIKFENQCCDCAVPGHPCKGDICEYRHVPVYICNKCKHEVHDLYEDDWGSQYCYDCLINNIYNEFGYDLEDDELDLIIDENYKHISKP